MPRRELNNPSARIQALLDDLTELESAYEEISALAAQHFPSAVFESLSEKPRLEATINERARQQFTSAKVSRARLAMRRKRYLEGKDSSKLSPEQVAEILQTIKDGPP